MRVLVACEFSGVVRDAFAAKGHEAWSADLIPSESEGGLHHLGDVRQILGQNWDLLIAHPPCQYLAVSGLHWNHRIPGRQRKTEEALSFAKELLEADVDKICLENPVGILSAAVRKPDQYIHPWEYGHPESKKTGLWLKGLPKLTPTMILEPPRRQSNGQPLWDNQTPSGQNRLGPSPTRAKERGRTYRGIASAMADQWG